MKGIIRKKVSNEGAIDALGRCYRCLITVSLGIYSTAIRHLFQNSKHPHSFPKGTFSHIALIVSHMRKTLEKSRICEQK